MAGSADSAPRFDQWGTDIVDRSVNAPAPPPERSRQGGRLPHPSRLGLALIGLVAAAAAAVAVHVAGGGSSSPASARLTRSSERSVAAAINLTVADLPGFSVEGSSKDVSVGGNPAGQFKSCFGGVVPTDSSTAFSSPNFDEHGSYGYVGIGSGVSFESAAELKRDAAFAKSARFAPCFARAFAAMSLTTHGTTITGSNPQAQTLAIAPPTGSGVVPILAMRASLTWTIRGVPVPFYFDLFLVGVGHDGVSLYSISLGQPFSITSEEQLVSTLVTRALAQPHE